MVFLYCKSISFVPLAERVALLQVGKSDPLIEAGTWVKVKNGRYQNDVGKVVSVMGNHDAVVVELKSREKLPNVPSSKRKRGRPEPYLLTKDKASGIGDGSRIKVTDDGFTFLGKSFTTDGYLLLEISCDRVQRISTGIEVHDLFVATESANAVEQRFNPKKIVGGATKPRNAFTPNSVPVSTPLFLNIGDHVLITGGEAKGARATINDLSENNAIVTLDEEAGTNLTKIAYVQTDLEHIARLFEFGERVQVKVGSYAGRSGTVGDLDLHGEGNMLLIVDREQNEVASFSFFLSYGSIH